jgi:Protein of unknown function DUF45
LFWSHIVPLAIPTYKRIRRYFTFAIWTSFCFHGYLRIKRKNKNKYKPKTRPNIEMHQIDVSGVMVDVVRMDIKNLHLAVYPPSGRIRVAAPLRVDNEAVRLAVISMLGWITKQQAKFTRQERQTVREYVSGESHYFQGALPPGCYPTRWSESGDDPK